MICTVDIFYAITDNIHTYSGEHYVFLYDPTVIRLFGTETIPILIKTHRDFATSDNQGGISTVHSTLFFSDSLLFIATIAYLYT